MLADSALQIRMTVVQPARRTDLEGRGDRSLKCSPGRGAPTPLLSRGTGEQRGSPTAAAHTATLATCSGTSHVSGGGGRSLGKNVRPRNRVGHRARVDTTQKVPSAQSPRNSLLK